MGTTRGGFWESRAAVIQTHLLGCITIDRQYTLNFFRGNTHIYHRNERALFEEIMRGCRAIADRCRPEIEQIRTEPDHEMNTSTTKVSDNAIVGYGVLSGRA